MSAGMSYNLHVAVVASGVMVGNFVYQALGSQRWSVAVERSWFQCVVIAAVLLLCRPASAESPLSPEETK